MENKLILLIVKSFLIFKYILGCGDFCNFESLTYKDLKETRYTTADNGLLLREDSNKNSKIIDKIPFNSEILVIKQTKLEIIDDIKDYWIQIEYKNKKGFVFGGYTSSSNLNIYSMNNGIRDMLTPFHYGELEDALHKGSGVKKSNVEDENMIKYDKCLYEIAEHFNEKGRRKSKKKSVNVFKQ